MKLLSSILFLVALGGRWTVEGRMSSKLTKFMATSGVGDHCRSQGWKEAQCIEYLKQLCGMQEVSDPEENAELEACLNRERCGKGVVPVVQTDRTKRFTMGGLRWKWKKKHIKYFLYNMPPKTSLSKSEMEEMTGLALDVWSCYSKLTFSKASSVKETDMIVMFSEIEHSWFNYDRKQVQNSSDRNPFDGPSGVLAHAFGPLDNKQGNLHMDNSERWSANFQPGSLNTFVTLVHEFGHVLGIEHSRNRKDVMAPFYRSIREGELDLGRWEKGVIQSLYGVRRCTDKKWQKVYSERYPKKEGESKGKGGGESKGKGGGGGVRGKGPNGDDRRCVTFRKSMCRQGWLKRHCRHFCGLSFVKRTSKSLNKRAKGGNMKHVCDRKALHGIFDFVDGFTYIISGGYLYRRDNAEGNIDMEFRRQVKAMWKSAPQKPSAAVYSRSTKSLYLFQASSVYVVSGLGEKIDSEEATVKRLRPKDSNYPVSPSAAFVKFDDRDSGNVHLVKGDMAYVLSTKTMRIVKSFPFKDLFEVGAYVNRIPRKVTGAYHLFEEDDENAADSLFFFTGSSYTMALPDQKTGKYNIPSGTQPFSTTYLHCPQQ